MKKLLQALILSCILVFSIKVSSAIAVVPSVTASVVLQGMCDASAVLKIGSQFLVLDDEDQKTTYLRLFDFSKGGTPVLAPALPTEALQIDPRHPELDFEGLAQIGDVYFAIASHSRSNEFKPRDSRKNLVAFRWQPNPNEPIEVLGSLTTLLPALQAKFDATPSIGISKIDPVRDPKQKDGDGGLSIEGISAMPNGNLLIGLRSPTNPAANMQRPRQAIAVELVNPLQSVTTRNATLGNVYLWQFEGAGIRDLAYDAAQRRVLILSGPPGAGGPFKLWTWNGDRAAQPSQAQDLTNDELVSQILADGSAPEGLTLDGNRIWLVFDEGKRHVFPRTCKDLPASNPQKTFRAIALPFQTF